MEGRICPVWTWTYIWSGSAIEMDGTGDWSRTLFATLLGCRRFLDKVSSGIRENVLQEYESGKECGVTFYKLPTKIFP